MPTMTRRDPASSTGASTAGAMPTVDMDGELSQASSVPPPAPSPGAPAATELRYAPQGEVGRGGMGVVLRAHDPALGRTVALKVLRPEFARSAGRVTRFVAEARLTAQLDHPAIVPVHAVGTDADGLPCYAMKLARGRTLHDLLKDARKRVHDARWPLPRLVRGLLQACDGIAFAHARGVVHRDLKPGNLLFGDYGEVWVLDWGVAARIATTGEVEPVDATLFTADGVAGTEGYASPEQLRPGVPVDARADVFALGVLLRELWEAFGRPVPAEIDLVCARATAEDPDRRYPSVRAFVAEVEGWLESERQRETEVLRWRGRLLKHAAATVEARAVRVHDALAHLAELTRLLFRAPAPRARVDRWLRELRFRVDEDGYFQPEDLAASVREGRAPPDALSWCWPPSRRKDPVARAHLFALREVGPALRTLVQRVPGLSFVYYADARNAALVFPADDMRDAVPPEFDFLSYPAFVAASPAHNPGRGLRVTPPHVDYGNKGLITAVTLPVWLGDTFVGVWAADVPVSVLHDEVRLGELDGLAVIVDRSGVVVAGADLPEAPGPKGSVQVRTVRDLGGVFTTLDLDHLFETGRGEIRAGDEHGRELVLQYCVVPTMGWVICNVGVAPSGA